MRHEAPVIFTTRHSLPASWCDPQCRLALPRLVQQLIDTATAHADTLGIGHARLAQFGALWVLSRLSVVMDRYPAMDQSYSIDTWVENFNRRFSQRNFRIVDADSQVIGRASSVWMAIDTTTGRAADLSQVADTAICLPDVPSGVPAAPRLHPVDDSVACSALYRFGVCDMDFNRHVTSRRYIELMVDNTLTLDTLDRDYISRFDIEFRHEALYGDTVLLLSQSVGDDIYRCDIVSRDNATPMCQCRLIVAPDPAPFVDFRR